MNPLLELTEVSTSWSNQEIGNCQHHSPNDSAEIMCVSFEEKVEPILLNATGVFKVKGNLQPIMQPAMTFNSLLCVVRIRKHTFKLM